MSQKISPKSFRIGVLYEAHSRWFAKKHDNFAQNLREDVEVRKFLFKELKEAALDKVDIERAGNVITIIVHTAKPGLIIGRGGTGAETLKKKIQTKFFPKGDTKNINLNIVEVQKPSLSARIVAQDMARDIEKRMPVRRVMKQAVERIEKAGALGAKVRAAGRLNGAEIARTESLLRGKVPLHNLRADIDYAEVAAHTIYGAIGVKVWVYRGDVFR